MTRRSWLNVMVRVVPMPLGLLLSGVLVWGASYADFTASTSNSGNTWSAGTIGLANDSRVPMFHIENMKPGEAGANCIQVRSNADVPTALKLFSDTRNWPSGYQSFVNLRVETGSGGSFGNCAGFAPNGVAFDGTLDTFVGLHADYRTGVGPWRLPATPATISFRFSWLFRPGTANGPQASGTPEVTFTWEARAG